MYTASLTACTASFVLATHCIKNTKHVSVQEDGGCVGLRCGHLVIICMLSHNELRPANMMPRSHNGGSAYCQASSSLPSFANRTCPAPVLLWCVSTQRQTLPATLDQASLWPLNWLCVVGFTPACWCFSGTRAGPSRTLGSSSPRLPISWSHWKAGTSSRGFGSCRRDGMCLALCWLSRNDLGWASECVLASSKTPLCRPPPHRCQPRPLLMRRSLGLVPKPRRRFAQGLLASAASSGCELYLLSLAACDVPPWSLLMVLSAYASDATDPRKTCDGVPAMFGARLSLPCCPSYPALYACLPSVHAVMLHSLAVAFRPLRGESYSTLCSPRSLLCLPQLRHEPCLSQAWNWGARYRTPRPLPAPRRKLRGWQRRRYWAGCGLLLDLPLLECTSS